MGKKASHGISLVPTGWFVGCLAALSVVFALVLDSYWISVLSLAMALGLFAFGVDFLQWTGLGSLGHAAWYGLAAYGTAILTVKLGWSPWLAMMAGVAISTTAAAVFAPLAIRMRGTSFLVITLAFGQVIWGLAVKLEKITGGSDGIPGVPRPGNIGPIDFQNPKVMFGLVMIVIIIVVTVAMRLLNGPLGAQLRAVKQSELRLRSLGYNVQLLKFSAFVISAFIVGVAGALAATLDQFVGVNYVVWTMSAEMLLATMVGGVGTLWGPFAAGFAIAIIRVLATDLTSRWTMILGLMYIFAVLVVPDGIASLLKKRQRVLAKGELAESAEEAKP